jgi:uncharacterized protein (TIGR00159 family)
MELFHIDFLPVRFIDMVDILLVALLMFQVYRLIRGSVAVSIFIGILFVYLIWIVVRIMKMELLGTILGEFIGVGFIALIIVFQQEVRRFLIYLGTNSILSRNVLTRQLLPWNWQTGKKQPVNINAIVRACRSMSENKTGAIIVIARSTDMKFYANTGDTLDASLSKRMLENIFFKNSPLHDGAVIISGNRILAARCVLPVTENPDLPAYMGMRHRAALGISEQSDALTIVVSEETGEIALTKSGEIRAKLTTEELEKILEKELG